MAPPAPQSTQNVDTQPVCVNPNLLTSDQFNLIPPFSGANDPQSIEDYFATVEEISDHFGWSSSNKYLAVKLKLTGEALHFIREQKFNIKDYDSLKNSLLERYSTHPNRANLVHEFFTFQQPSDMPVSVFFAKASALSFKAFCSEKGNKEREELNRIDMLKSMLLSNLAPEIRRGVIAANPQTLDEIKEAALLQERAWSSCRTTSSIFASNEASPSPIYAVQPSGRTTTPGVEEMYQKLADEIKTLSAKVADLTKEQNRKQQLCFACNRPGHISRFCPRRSSSQSNQPLRRRQNYGNTGRNYFQLGQSGDSNRPLN